MGQGANFYIGDISDIKTYPMNDRTSMIFELDGDEAIFMIDCNSFRNQATFKYLQPDQPAFEDNRGPDILDCNHFEQYLEAAITQYPKYFKVRTSAPAPAPAPAPNRPFYLSACLTSPCVTQSIAVQWYW